MANGWTGNIISEQAGTCSLCSPDGRRVRRLASVLAEVGITIPPAPSTTRRRLNSPAIEGSCEGSLDLLDSVSSGEDELCVDESAELITALHSRMDAAQQSQQTVGSALGVSQLQLCKRCFGVTVLTLIVYDAYMMVVSQIG